MSSPKLRLFGTFCLVVVVLGSAPMFTRAATLDVPAILAQLADLNKQLAALQAAQNGSAVTGTCAITIPLIRGMRNSEVVCAQQFLISQQLLPVGSATGYFGLLTEAAVKQFQAREGIVSYGSPATTGYGAIGIRTRARIQTLKASSSIPAPTPIPGPAISPIPPSPATSTIVIGGGGGGNPPPPIPPLPPETPSCVLSASPSSIPAGTSFTLSWTTVNVVDPAEIRQGNSLSLYYPSTQGGSGGKLPNGSQTFTLGAAGNYTYTMSVKNSKGSANCSTTVTSVGTPALVDVPVVRGGLALAGFGSGYYSATDRTKRDIVWATGDPQTGPFGGFYIPYDREPLGEPGRPLTHDQAWYLTNHPDWLVYKEDRTSLANSFSYGTEPNKWFLMPIDVTNQAVRDYVWERRVTPVIMQGFKAISFDNVGIINSNGRAGVKTPSGWKQLFNPANWHDPAYLASVQDFLRSSRIRLHTEGLRMLANVGYGYGYENEFLTASRETDITLLEGAFLYSCKRNDAHVNNDYPDHANDYWTRRFNVLRTVAEERGLILADICYEGTGSILDLEAEDVSWAIANFLLVRGERTYMMLTDIKEIYKVVDRPEYEKAEKMGLPTETPKQEGGVWTRRYEGGLVAINPSAKNTTTLSLGTVVYKDLLDRTFAGTISIPPATGLVLFRQAELVPIPTWTTDNVTFATADTNTSILTETATTSRHRINTYLMPIPNGHTTSELWTLSLRAKQVSGGALRRISLSIMGYLEQSASSASSICTISGEGGVAWSGKNSLASQLSASGHLESDGWYYCSLEVKPNSLNDNRLRLMLELLTPTSPSGYLGDGSSGLMLKDIQLEVRPNS